MLTTFQQATGRAKRDPKTKMAPRDAPRWYDGEPKLPPATVFRKGDAQTALWLIRVVLSNPGVQVDHG